MEPILKAVLGPTNTGKTHYAVERMLGHSSGVIGLPLRLLAREIYDRIVERLGPKQVALITGEEKISPPTARYFVCTVEAMPATTGRDGRRFAFLAVDEVQLMAHHERGHVFTDRVLHARGTEETLFLGAETARDVLRTLVPKIRFDRRERFSTLHHGGPVKLTRLPKRSVVVAFSTQEVYALAELLRRYRGGAAVVMGGLSPRTRNAQAELFQSGDVDFLVATDAVGMGLNLDTDHVAFAGLSKYDGRRRRRLTPMEAAQIAGRAGRFRNDGTFGTTGDCLPMDEELVRRIEAHEFEALHYVSWRNSDLDFASLKTLGDSLRAPRPTARLRRIKGAIDEAALERFMAINEVSNAIRLPVEVRQLWEVCQIPDFRNLTIDAHFRLLQDIYRLLRSSGGKLPDDFMESRISRLDDISGGVDILSSRLAHIRTWTYCASRPKWMQDANHWVNRAREVEDRLSDALHETLTARFVDRRTSKLLKGMGANALMDASIKDDGNVFVDGSLIGSLKGLKFTVDPSATGLEAKTLEAAASKAVAPEVDRRLTSLASGIASIFMLSDQGEIRWGDMSVGKIAKSGSVFNPDVELIGAELGNPQLRVLAENRMREYLRSEVKTLLAPLFALKELADAKGTDPAAKGFAYILHENFGSLERRDHLKTIRDLEQEPRRQLRSAGVRFGHYNVFMPELTKPKPARLLSLLIAYGAGGDGKPFLPFAGVTSIPNEGELASSNFTEQALALAGYRAVGPRIVRFDILNRLSTMIRDAQAYFNAHALPGNRQNKFQIAEDMLALLGAGFEETQGVLRALNFKSETAAEPLTRPEEPIAATPDAAPESPSEAPEAPKADDAAAEKATPETPKETSQEATPDSPSNKASEKPGVTPDMSNRVKKRINQRRPIKIFHLKETLEDGTTVTHPNLEYWFMPARGQKGFNPRVANKDGGDKRPNRTRRKPDRKGGGKGSKPAMSAGPKKSKSFENSPFAALAALKAPDSNKGPKK